MGQIKKKDPENPMVEHHLEDHDQEEVPKLHLELVKRVAKPLERQVLEEYLIGNSKPEVSLMNRRGELGQNLPPKFVLEDEKPGTLRGKKTNPAKHKRDSLETPVETELTVDIIDDTNIDTNIIDKPDTSF